MKLKKEKKNNEKIPEIAITLRQNVTSNNTDELPPLEFDFEQIPGTNVIRVNGIKETSKITDIGDSTIIDETGKHDVLVWIDASGSMTDEISQIKTSLRLLTNTLSVQNGENRIAFIQGNTNTITLSNSLSSMNSLSDETTWNTFSSFINRLNTSAGGENPRLLLSAVNSDLFNWYDDTNKKVLISITDESDDPISFLKRQPSFANCIINAKADYYFMFTSSGSTSLNKFNDLLGILDTINTEGAEVGSHGYFISCNVNDTAAELSSIFHKLDPGKKRYYFGDDYYDCYLSDIIEHYSVVDIPSEIDGKSVLEIGKKNSEFERLINFENKTRSSNENSEFFGNYEYNPTSTIIIPDTVSVINDQSFFYVSSLLSVEIGKDIKKIENNAFTGCIQLSSISIKSKYAPVLNYTPFGNGELNYTGINTAATGNNILNIPKESLGYENDTYDSLFDSEKSNFHIEENSEMMDELKNMLHSAGIYDYNSFKNEYLNQLTLSDVISSYDAVKWHSELSVSEDDFNKFIEDYNAIIVTKQELGIKSFVEISSMPGVELISMDDYDKYIVGNHNLIPTDEIKIVDITRGQYENDPKIDLSSKSCYLGIVPIIVSPINALMYQGLLSKNDSWKLLEGLSSQTISIQLSNLELTSYDNLAQIAESYFPQIDYTTWNQIDNTYLKRIGIVVFKMTADLANNNLIEFSPVEAYSGTLNKTDKDQTTGANIFIDDVVNRNSNIINVFSNINYSGPIQRCNTYLIKNQIAKSLGFTPEQCQKNISVNSIKKSLQEIFNRLQNPNDIKIDILADIGTSNIARYIGANGKSEYNPDMNIDETVPNENNLIEWKNIANMYDDFCRNIRKDCMFILDSPRNFCLKGSQKILRRTNSSATFMNSLFPSLKYMVFMNSSYGAGYCNWFRCIDDTIRYYMWMPPTVKVIEAYLRTDNQYNFWEAPAGSRRGIMSETYDVAFNPSEKDAEKIYINRWNYAVSFPLEGILLEGQKTFQRNQTAFDRVNVRRLFLRIEKDVKRMARTFLYEGITERNMMRFRDMVNTYLQDIQTKDGIRDFYVICDGRNNTNETVDNNEMHCSIGIMPVKSLEFIILNFICTTQSANVEEVTSQYI